MRASLLLLLFAGVAEAQTSLTLTLQEYPPLMGQALPQQGMLSSVVKAVFERAGYAVIFAPTPNNRAIEAPRRGLADGSLGWAKTPEREQELYYTKPVMALRMVFCQQQGKSYDWKTLVDLAPYRIGITLGNYYSDAFDQLAHAGKLKTDVAPSDEANLRKLLAGRIDLFPMDAEVGPYLIRRTLAPVDQARLICPDHAYWSAPLHVVISKKRADGVQIVAAFDQALATMQQSGELKKRLDNARKQNLDAPVASAVANHN